MRSSRVVPGGWSARDAEPSAVAPYGVTPRELELLGKIATGADNAAIASALFLSTKTVQNNVSLLMGKLGGDVAGAPGRAGARPGV